MLKLQNLSLARGQNTILEAINLSFDENNLIVLFSPNGSGKTTLAQSICGYLQSSILKGKILLQNQDITTLNSTKRSQLGIFCSFQYPPEIPGITTQNLIKESYTAIFKQKPIAKEFLANIKKYNQLLGLKPEFYKQEFNLGASGGEKKKNELLQMLMLQPKIVVLDEVDSGLDVKSKDNLLKILKDFKQANRLILVITHDQDFYQKLKPDKVYTIINHKITEL